MKRIKQKTKKKLLFATPVAIVLAVAITFGVSFVVYAISRNTSTIDNSARVATSGVSIVESSDPGFGRHEISFYNNADTNSPVLLRIAYSETWTDNDNNVISNLGGNSANVVTKTWTNDFAQYFEDGHDGWYYYDKT